jgi:protein-disulfide isomerase
LIAPWARFWSKLLPLTRRFPRAVRFLAALTALIVFALPIGGAAVAQNAIATSVAKPVSLPDMALGQPAASVTIVEYSSLTCPHCAAFAENVFPMLQSKYIDTGKVRFVSREFPLDIKAAAASMLARCVGNGDAIRYFDAVGQLFKQQEPLVSRTVDTLNAIGDRFGMNEAAVEACVKDQALLDKITADQKFAVEELKVDATPTFFINGEMLKGAMSFEELDNKLSALLKHCLAVLAFALGFLRRRNEGEPDPVLLDPDHPAIMNRAIACHHQAEAGGNEGRVFDVDSRALGRNVAHRAAHDGTA